LNPLRDSLGAAGDVVVLKGPLSGLNLPWIDEVTAELESSVLEQ
jgi:hypothetical protein